MYNSNEVLNWREIFDTSHRPYKDVLEASEVAQAVGYPYFCWNGRVLETGTAQDTGIAVVDIAVYEHHS